MQMARVLKIKIQSKWVTKDICRGYLFTMTLLEVLGKTHMSVHDNNHAFIQANSNDVRFMGIHEDLQVFMHKDVVSSKMRISPVNENFKSEDTFLPSTYLKFVPSHLDFKERFLGVPHLEKVTLINTNENKTIYMSSVSGNTLHFHSSFFQHKAIPPKGNTTFSVVFLGHMEGPVSTNLYIHTSEGIFKYQVSGASICSPYRLRPLGGVRLPLNAAFQPLIQLYNPHHYPIQVVEVYSSGREFYLELPGGETEGPKTLWEVPPYTTKPVIRAKFQASAQSNHTAYIRLKLNNSEEVLVVPLEIEVTSQPGLYSHQHFIDFGIGGSQDKPKKIILYLCNSLKKTLRIHSVSTVPASSSLKVNFETTKIPPGTSPVEVAELVFDWKLAFEMKETSGKIIIKSKQNQYKLKIPFMARVLEGGLKVNEKSTRFLTSETRFLPKHFIIENQFLVSVAVNNVSLLPEANIFFHIKNFKPMVIPPKKSVTLLTLFLRNSIVKDIRLESGIILFTNVSDVTIPLFVYNGKLTKGKVCTQPLKFLSTFSKAMTVTSVSSMPPDSRLSFTPAPGGAEILPGTSSYIGDLKLEPAKHCKNNCYLGLTQNSSDGFLWMSSKTLLRSTAEMDATLLRDRYYRLLNITENFGSGYWQDMVLRLITNSVKEKLFKAKVRFIWPKFSSTNKLVFPLTQVSNTTVQRLKLFNSASHMVVLQLVMEWAYPQSKGLIDSFPTSFRSNLKGNCYDSSAKEFNFFGKSSTLADQGKLNVALMPGERFEVSISFTPNSAQKSCTFLFIRNNLTVIEVVEIHGQASYAQLKFGNRRPGSENPLMFEIAEKHLRDCQRGKKDKKSSNPNLTVKRSFTVRNVGELSVYVHNFYINGLKCEGYGYSVLNCDSFELPINGTKKIDVAFTPDFTLTKIQRLLTIDTSLGINVNYTLVTTLPPLFLSACSSVLSRPTWEPLLYYSAVSFMVFFLFCVLAAAFFESDRILKCALTTLVRERTLTAPLDLRQIGSNVTKEFIHNTGKRMENNSDHFEKIKLKDVVAGGSSFNEWSQSHNVADDKHFSLAQKDEGCGMKNNDPLPSGKDKEVTITAISNFVQLNNLTKHKKKLTKKHSSNSDITVEQTQEIFLIKKKEKSVSSSGWCSVFSRGNAEKTKIKMHGLESESVKKARIDADTVKKEEGKKDEKKGNKCKKICNKEMAKEEEETSSTTTEGSNDAEKENAEMTVVTATISATVAASSKAKNDKLKKSINKEKKVVPICELKENTYMWNCDNEESEKERKTFGKTLNKIHLKNNKLGNAGDVEEINSWKTNATVDGSKNLNHQKHKLNKFGREKKEKAGSKRKFAEKIVNFKSAEPSVVHRSSPCWEHRSFSEVVARNDNPSVFSNTSSSRNEHQKQRVPSEPVFSEAEKVSDGSISTLGPIGSKKPLSHWSPLSYGCSESQSSTVFGSGFADLSANRYLQPSSPTSSTFLEAKNHSVEESMPIDRENLWEEQHAAMQLFHQQDTSYQLSWKENWLDYLWCSNRNVQRSEENPSTSDAFENETGANWGSLLRTSWNSPTLWNPSNNHDLHCFVESNNACQFSNYDAFRENQRLLNSTDGQNACIDLGTVVGQNSAPLNQVLFGSSNGPFFRSSTGENLTGNVFQFDPFHSLRSIWSSKTQNTWNSSEN